MPDNAANNKRIAKNTVVLYFRTILILLVSLYTSRVVVATLGVDDFGVYGAVGGIVGMMAVISGALSAAISRFITFELGKGDKDKLSRVFCTGVNIQVIISLAIIILGETLGLWYLNTRLNIPPDRLTAANFVLHFSLLSFAVDLLSIPYNATITAHEHMKAFAYVSILEAVLKLAIVFMLAKSPFDRLVTYVILLFIVSVIIRIIYGLYCRTHFEESKYRFILDRPLFKEMFSFAGWNFLTNAAYIFNTQGVNILITNFFGVAITSARTLATQVESSVIRFVGNFTTAINPQITKSYAADEKDRLFTLVCTGAKYSFFLLFIMSLPIILETEFILGVWLKEVPEHTVAFVRLAFAASFMNILGNTGYTACQATGKIRKYVLVITPIGCLVFFLSWLAFTLGAPAEITYVVYAGTYLVIDIVRLFLMKGMLDFPIMKFVREVFAKMALVIVTASVIPVLPVILMESSVWRFLLTLTLSLISVGISVYFLGMKASEREMIKSLIINKILHK